MLEKFKIHFSTALLLSLFITFSVNQDTKAQTIEILAGNTFNGAMNGAILGGATMGLQNSDNFDPVRIGVGLGTLYGIGVGIYDLARVSPGEQLYVSGMFNDGTNTSIIVLLDTFYGAATGAIISTAVTLITKEPILDGLQYGTSAGAWIGFGFGIFDAFVLSKKLGATQAYASPSTDVNGFITLKGSNSNIQAGFLSPGYSSHAAISNETIKLKHSLNLEVLNLKVGF